MVESQLSWKPRKKVERPRLLLFICHFHTLPGGLDSNLKLGMECRLFNQPASPGLALKYILPFKQSPF